MKSSAMIRKMAEEEGQKYNSIGLLVEEAQTKLDHAEAVFIQAKATNDPILYQEAYKALLVAEATHETLYADMNVSYAKHAALRSLYYTRLDQENDPLFGELYKYQISLDAASGSE